VFEFIAPEDHQQAHDLATQLLAENGSRGGGLYRLRHVDGSWRLFTVVITNLIGDPDVGLFLCTGRDVTDQHELEELFRSAFEGSPIGMAVLGIDGVPLQVNQALCDLLGRPREVMLRHSLLDALNDEGRAVAARELARVEQGHEPRASEVRLRHASGQELAVRVHGSRLAAPAGVDRLLIQVLDITEEQRYQELLAHQAGHDPLTGLPNRAAVLGRLQEVLDSPSRQAVLLFCDLDRFKVVNDSLGHHVGDEILVQLAGRLRSAIRPADLVGRLGGDEFVVVCADLRRRSDAHAIAQRIADLLDEPFVVDGSPFTLSTSIGIAYAEDLVRDPAGGTRDAAALLRNADSAMYRAKEHGRARWEVFDEEHHQRLIERAHTERALRRAIDHDELRLLFQPVVALHDGRVVATEALVRWAHPERGLLGPGEFVPLAEECGLIVPLGAWVLRTATRQLAAWRQEGRASTSTVMSVNLSGRQLASGEVTEVVAAALDEAGLPAHCLQLEVTESVLLEDARTATRTLADLRSLGVRLAIDDFGTGYSALTHLKRFPFTTLKIDRSFVQGIGRDRGDEAIVAAVTGMAAAFGLELVAEGIEHGAQVGWLRAHGVPYGQGFLFAQPLATAEAAAVLGRRLDT